MSARKRRQSKSANGRFRRNTLANTFGFKVHVCSACRGCNTQCVGAPAPETCHHCGAKLDTQVDDDCGGR